MFSILQPVLLTFPVPSIQGDQMSLWKKFAQNVARTILKLHNTDTFFREKNKKNYNATNSIPRF
jgi:hypothetical protein